MLYTKAQAFEPDATLSGRIPGGVKSALGRLARALDVVTSLCTVCRGQHRNRSAEFTRTYDASIGDGKDIC